MREVNAERVRDLQQESSNLVVCLPPQVGLESWRRLNGIHQMCPGPGRGEQRATRSRPYIRRTSSRGATELWGPGEPGGHLPLHLAPAWEQSIPLFSGELRSFFPVHLGNLDWSSRERSLSGCLVESLVSGYVINLRVSLTEEEGDAFMGALRIDRMEDCPVVEMEGDMEVVDVEFGCRD